MSLPETWEQARLTDVCELNPRLLAEDRPNDGTTVTFVPMSAVDEDSGVISKPETRSFTEVAKGYTSFRERDVLFAKVTPCMENGKAAVARDLENGLGFGSTEFHVLRPTSVVLPEYVFSFIRQKAFRDRAAAAFVGTGGLQRVPPDFLSRVKIPLPTLPEQKRIVDVLRQTEVVAKAKKSISDQFDHLVRTAYWEYFGKWFTADGLIDPVRISDYVADSQYGVSEAMGETGTHAVLRMNSITTSGWIDLSNLKYASLSKKDISSTELRDGDLLFNRTNSKELVGKCAVWRPVAGTYSFASYLVRFRLKPEMLPEYLWATLNSAYGKYRLLNSAKQAVSMANVSPTGLGRITVPLPPLLLQEAFAKFVRKIELLRAQMLSKLELYSELQEIITQRALIGELTAQWRALHTDEIVEAGKVRDALLRKHGAKVSLTGAAKTSFLAQADITVRPTRHWLLAELSEFQRRVLKGFSRYEFHPVFTEDTSDFAAFCDSDAVRDALGGLEWSPNQVGRALGVLADLGLIAQVSILRRDVATNSDTFHKAFRPLREDERTRLDDISALKRMSRFGDEADVSYHFRASLDRETSARAGADEMFQVTQLEDDYGHSRTDWIDQGRHYADLNALRDDLAKRLGVAPSLVTVEEIA
ncbi:restriction endonuclease subunit S [Pseudomonas gingeri]|uniref:restriction endonuclease subunit S n=1 Tax=Pseudomonas gingeri TaxID=117681 RepID=UPI00159FEF83|nr:restriction endonuclease subunit S [Pseudomonas gingeri]NWA04544.1 restriction endonuclease subunit S [Pseudomonas gingeri]NWA17353.1 restriction endonuclease subunit S [Pseudomonas gingeri]NWA56375.1 restriction endonuclease subunit S [Pseudomonas gingeri]NWA98063.1 restriction endonuclease subunit S [Pseudomonas gingeri]NWB02569.1 restriction endonuclease subunit S [Pseudomonas gingeri]